MAAYRTPGPLGKYLSPLTSVDNGRAFRLAPFSSPNAGITAQGEYAGFDAGVINAMYFNTTARSDMEKGATPKAIVRLPTGTMLYRIGSTRELRRGSPKTVDDAEREQYLVAKPLEANCTSPWWLRRQELDRILAKGQQDTAWAGRIMAAIAKVWGSDCDLQICVTTTCDLYAWIGEPKSVDVLGNSVGDMDPDAFWIPEKDLMQLYIPGMWGTQLWRHVFRDVCATRWLWAGTQNNLATGRAFVPARDKQTAMPPGKR